MNKYNSTPALVDSGQMCPCNNVFLIFTGYVTVRHSVFICLYTERYHRHFYQADDK